MLQSMTGFAGLTGETEGFGWIWDVRSVNARGLDIRLRLPDRLDGVEETVRKAIKSHVARGSISVSLKLSQRDDAARVALNADGLHQALGLLTVIVAEAGAKGVQLSPVTAADIAGMRGVVNSDAGAEIDLKPVTQEITAQIPALLDQFIQSRSAEGAELAQILSGQVDQIEALVTQAEALLETRNESQREGLQSALARVLENTDGADPERVAQELAIIAVKTDVREELDRLSAHVNTARSLLGTKEPVGRKLDFLMQEFNREANTLCSKAQFKELTTIGLDLKHVIDQMREQVQNVE